jgi:hypothetical protein
MQSGTPRLKIRLLRGWTAAANPRGLATYVRQGGSGTLQFSLAQYKNDALPTTEATLISICEKLTSSVRGRRDVSSSSGNCEFGIFGTVLAKGDSPAHVQAWVLSNRREFILVTHTSDSDPDSQEVKEANEIALMTACA